MGPHGPARYMPILCLRLKYGYRDALSSTSGWLHNTAINFCFVAMAKHVDSLSITIWQANDGQVQRRFFVNQAHAEIHAIYTDLG